MSRHSAAFLVTILCATAAIVSVSEFCSVNKSQVNNKVGGTITTTTTKTTTDEAQSRMTGLNTEQIPAATGARTSDRFPNIELLDHRGRHLKFYDDLVRDRSVCIVFFYTRCTGSCPGTTVALKQLRENLRGEFPAEDFAFISLTLEPEVDTAEELREYMARYQIDNDDETLPDWVYATGDYEELDGLRRSLGVYDLDPDIDANKAEHAAIITFGNDRTNRWAALPTGIQPGYLTDTIIRIAGNSQRQRYASVIAAGTKNVDRTKKSTRCDDCEKSCCELKAQ